MAKTAESATIVEASHVPDVVVGATVYGDEAPFAVGDIAGIARQPYYAYDDGSASLETQWRDAGVPGSTSHQEPTFQQACPWFITDDWSNCSSQIPDDEQIIPVAPEPQPTHVVPVFQPRPVVLKQGTQCII